MAEPDGYRVPTNGQEYRDLREGCAPPVDLANTSPAFTLAEARVCLTPLTRTFPAAANLVAKVRVLKNRACQSHLSTRMDWGSGFLGALLILTRLQRFQNRKRGIGVGLLFGSLFPSCWFAGAALAGRAGLVFSAIFRAALCAVFALCAGMVLRVSLRAGWAP